MKPAIVDPIKLNEQEFYRQIDVTEHTAVVARQAGEADVSFILHPGDIVAVIGCEFREGHSQADIVLLVQRMRVKFKMTVSGETRVYGKVAQYRLPVRLSEPVWTRRGFQSEYLFPEGSRFFGLYSGPLPTCKHPEWLDSMLAFFK